MTKTENAKVQAWLCEPLILEAKQRIERLARLDNIVGIAIMPDVHIAQEFCVGTVVATRSWILPQAIGGDIGCGMAAIRINASADLINPKSADRILGLLKRFVPSNRQSAQLCVDSIPNELLKIELSDQRIERMKYRDGRVQFGTLGRGNHFLEFQSDKNGQLWLMVHTGSRSIGQAISSHHVRAAPSTGVFQFIESNSPAGQDYLHDARWAMQYAAANRRHILASTYEMLRNLFSVEADEDSLIESDHNHVRKETHLGGDVWIHRKGAQAAHAGTLGVIPGSMATPSYHVEGRGCEDALSSSSHGAGRRMSRGDARRVTSSIDCNDKCMTSFSIREKPPNWSTNRPTRIKIFVGSCGLKRIW